MVSRLLQALSLAPASAKALSIPPKGRASTTALAVASVAGNQWGVITRAQLIECGLSGSLISRWVQAGHLIRLYPGVYAVGHASLPYEGRLTAALFATGAGAGLSHESAMHWWELLADPPDQIHVSVPSRRAAPGPGVRVHHPRELVVVRHRRLTVTPPAQTLRAYAAHASLRDVRKALGQADFHRRFDPKAIADEIGKGRPGSRTLRQALEKHLPQLAFAESELEVEFIFLCDRFGLPMPRVNVWVGSKRVDAYWPEIGLVVELDSESAHGTAARSLADRQRDLELRGLGLEVRRYSWHQVFAGAAEVAADLRLALAPTPA